MSYDIKALDTEKSGIKQVAATEEGILPKFPFSWVISGRSGSGKTVLLLNLLTREEFYKGYFQYIIVYSPTAGKKGSGMDDTYDILDIPSENFVPEFNSESLEELLEARKDLINDKGIDWVGENSRVLLILDDCIAERKFLQSPSALKMFALLRHYLCSVIILTQSYNKVPRPLRLNAMATCVFPTTQTEVNVLADEVRPAGVSKKAFEELLDYCTEGQYDFLYINNHADKREKIRKNLDEIIDLDAYKKK